MIRAIKFGLLSSIAIYVVRLLIAFIRLVLAQPRFGGISGFPLSAIWIDAILFFPWFVVSAVVVTVAFFLASRTRAA